MLILDLDDTIFETQSMTPRIFDSAISLLRNHFEQTDSSTKPEEVVRDLWSIPIDVVFEKHKVRASVVFDFYRKIEEIDYHDLDVRTFEDYSEIRMFSSKKILVTTGILKLQLAKIKALGIENDFNEIHIDDPRLNPRNHKIDIFRQLLLDSNLSPEDIWVIGDNPESEIKVGKQLGMKTIQRKSKSKKESTLADYCIESFRELKGIIEA